MLPAVFPRVALCGRGILPMGMGLWSWGDKLFWNFNKEAGEADAKRAFNAALAHNIELFDTAEVYINSEEYLGKFIESNHGTNSLVASKFAPYPQRWFNPRNCVHEALDHSLSQLKLSSIDLYQIHYPPSVPFLLSLDSIFAQFTDAHAQGKIRHIGVSNFSLKQIEFSVRTLSQKGIRLASVQMPYSLMDRSIERSGVMQYCKENGIAVIGYSPLGMGALTGKYKQLDSKVQTPRRFSSYFRSIKKSGEILEELARLSQRYDKTIAQIALNWVVEQGVIPIPGARNAQQAKENCEAISFRMKEEDLLRLSSLSEKFK
jgi:aryl-alcohol dehydrogenase-like predicted oxidoreductase